MACLLDSVSDNIFSKVVPLLIVHTILLVHLIEDLVCLRVIHQLAGQRLLVSIGKLFDHAQLSKWQRLNRLNREINVFLPEGQDDLQASLIKFKFVILGHAATVHAHFVLIGNRLHDSCVSLQLL